MREPLTAEAHRLVDAVAKNPKDMQFRGMLADALEELGHLAVRPLIILRSEDTPAVWAAIHPHDHNRVVVGSGSHPLERPDVKCSYSRRQINDFIVGYVAGALWSSIDDKGEPLDSTYSESDIHPTSALQLIHEAVLFYKKWWHWIIDHQSATSDAAGQDLWLTAQRHGSGFWEDDTIPYEVTTDAHKIGEDGLYVGDVGGVAIHCYLLRPVTFGANPIFRRPDEWIAQLAILEDARDADMIERYEEMVESQRNDIIRRVP